MFFERIETPGIAHGAYVFGDGGQAAVVDPRRDVDEYLRVARDNGARIAWVIETHRQEDFVLGSSELARITGAKIVNGTHELFGHGDVRLGDGDELAVAGLRLRALHTPGHTPESMSYALFTSDAPEHAWAVLTGDALFVGQTGRTDLPDPKRTRENAELLYDAVHAKLLPLGDQTLLLPAHGSGSVCGAKISDRDWSTIGLERRYNPVFVKSRAEFAASKADERLPRPPYFRVMEQVNLRGGIPLARHPREVPLVPPKELERAMGRATVIDARTPEAFAGGHLPGSYSVWLGGLPVFGGWIAQPSTPVFLVLASTGELERAVLSLARIGIDGVEGVLAGGFEAWRDAGLPIERSGTISPREVERDLGRVRVLDVRDDREFAVEGHLPGASHLYVGHLEEGLRDLRPPLAPSERVVVTCSVGNRASLAASILRRRGFQRVENLLGGMTAWKKLELPLERREP